MSRAQEWAEARARTEVAAAAAADAAVDAEESEVDGEPDYVADAVDVARGALEEAVAAVAEALGEAVATARDSHVSVASYVMAARYADLAEAIHLAVCAVVDGTGSVDAVRLAVAAARGVIS